MQVILHASVVQCKTQYSKHQIEPVIFSSTHIACAIRTVIENRDWLFSQPKIGGNLDNVSVNISLLWFSDSTVTEQDNFEVRSFCVCSFKSGICLVGGCLVISRIPGSLHFPLHPVVFFPGFRFQRRGPDFCRRLSSSGVQAGFWASNYKRIYKSRDSNEWTVRELWGPRWQVLKDFLDKKEEYSKIEEEVQRQKLVVDTKLNNWNLIWLVASRIQ